MSDLGHAPGRALDRTAVLADGSASTPYDRFRFRRNGRGQVTIAVMGETSEEPVFSETLSPGAWRALVSGTARRSPSGLLEIRLEPTALDLFVVVAARVADEDGGLREVARQPLRQADWTAVVETMAGP